MKYEKGHVYIQFSNGVVWQIESKRHISLVGVIEEMIRKPFADRYSAATEKLSIETKLNTQDYKSLDAVAPIIKIDENLKIQSPTSPTKDGCPVSVFQFEDELLASQRPNRHFGLKILPPCLSRIRIPVQSDSKEVFNSKAYHFPDLDSQNQPSFELPISSFHNIVTSQDFFNTGGDDDSNSNFISILILLFVLTILILFKKKMNSY